MYRVVARFRYGLKLGHCVGHGIGTTGNESRWFVPSDKTVLEPGMEMCIETGTYSEKATGKCETTPIVCEGGDPEIFPDSNRGIELGR